MDQINTNTTVEEKEVLKINLPKPLAFNSVGDVKITTTNELAKEVNEVLVKVFKDYYGCNLQVQQKQVPGGFTYAVVPVLLFKVLKAEEYTEGDIFAFKPIAADPAKDVVSRVQRIAQMGSMPGVKVNITDDGKSILSDFTMDVPRNQEFDWKTAYTTKTTDEGTFILVYKLDMIKFINKLYGTVNEFGSKQHYEIRINGVVFERNQYRANQNWGLNILRIDQNNEQEAAALLGYYFPNLGSVDAITATMSNPTR